MATAAERRLAVRNSYRKMIGRNHYSQARRNYALKKYKDGKYYSDCSSSVSYAHKDAGESFGILNTVGMWTSKKFVDVPVVINKNGTIANPEILEIGDILLFAGNDKGRKKYGYVGHVEMVGEISGSKIMLYGHGSGLAKKHEMNAYCKTRRSTKASTPLGHRGLIRVRRHITGDGEQLPETPVAATGAALAVLEKGSIGPDVVAMQKLLLKWEPRCLPEYGADGDFGDETRAALLAFQLAAGIEQTGKYDDETAHSLLLAVGATVEITGGTVNVRSGPGKKFPVLGVARKGTALDYQGMWEYSDEDSLWLLVAYTPAGANAPRNAWVSEKYAEVRA